ncbi:MAG TPA: type II secretion system protein GspJ [Candidatus Binatia bacterium]|nr:type II secretion system protein GspJ [Candidatus Binatia bacterium]
MTWSPFPFRPAQAFTLIEVLIATVAFAIVLAAINTVFYAAMRLRNKTAAAVDEALPAQQTIAILQRDLANMVAPGGVLSGQLQSTPVTKRLAGQTGPEFYSATGAIDQTSPWAEVQRVSYLLLDSTNRAGGKDLVRAVTRNLLPLTAVDQPAQQWLMGGVQSMSFLFYDGAQWRDAWDSTTADTTTGQTNNLPRAIKVQLQLVAAPTTRALALPAPIELVVPVVVQAATNQVAQSAGGPP